MAPARATRTRRERDAGRREIRNTQEREVLVVEVELRIVGIDGIDRGLVIALFLFRVLVAIDVGQVCRGTRRRLGGGARGKCE